MFGCPVAKNWTPSGIALAMVGAILHIKTVIIMPESMSKERRELIMVGSAPCMPARRDILTGRLNFLERSWGPIEPFDITLPKVLAEKNVFSHIVTDHPHYFRLGGEDYVQQFSTWDFYRGQEGDPWISKIDIAPCRQPLSAETRHVFLLVKLMTFHVELRT